MQVAHTSQRLLVTQVPPGTASVRIFTNGLLALQPPWPAVVAAEASGEDAAGGDSLTIPLEDLVPERTGDTPLPDAALVTVCAYDADRGEIGRCSVPNCPLPNARRAFPPDGPSLTGNRLVASTLQRPGERHVWRFRIRQDLVPPDCATAPMLLVCLRCVFDMDPYGTVPSVPSVPSVPDGTAGGDGADAAPLAVVHWATESQVPAHKRPYGASLWGEQTGESRIGVHDPSPSPTTKEAVFIHSRLREDVTETDVHCQLEWISPDRRLDLSGLRYVVYAHVVSDLHSLPFPLPGTAGRCHA